MCLILPSPKRDPFGHYESEAPRPSRRVHVSRGAAAKSGTSSPKPAVLSKAPPRSEFHEAEAEATAARSTAASAPSETRHGDEAFISWWHEDNPLAGAVSTKSATLDNSGEEIVSPGPREEIPLQWRGPISRASAPSRSRYDDEHIISSRRDDRKGKIPAGGSASKSVALDDVDEDNISAHPQNEAHSHDSGDRTNQSGYQSFHGIVNSTSKYDDEHIISSKSGGGTSSGRKGGGVFGMFSGQSSHGNAREGERRIGERLVGSAYGPGRFLTARSSMKPKKETEKANATSTARPKEYGI